MCIEANISGFFSVWQQKLLNGRREGKCPVTGLSFGDIPGDNSAGNLIDSVIDMDSMAVKVEGFLFESQNLASAQT